MKAVICIAMLGVLVAAVAGQRLETVTKQLASGVTYYTINEEDIFTDQRDAGNRIWGAPLPPTQASPQSDRVLDLQWVPPTAAVTALNNPVVTNWATQLDAANRFVLGFSGLTGNQRGQVIDVKFEAPYLEVDPATCTLAGMQQSCRCNPDNAALAAGNDVRPYLTDAQKIVFSGTVPTDPTVSTVAVTPIRQSTFFEHAPFIGQDPFARTYRRLCYRIAGGGWIDTRVLVAVTQGCLDGTAQGNSDTSFMTLCSQKNNTFLTVVGNAAAARFIDGTTQAALRLTLGDFYVTDNTGAVTTPPLSFVGLFNGETGPMRQDRIGRTTCCGATAAGVVNPQEVGGPTPPARFGVCIDPTQASCCGRRAYTTTQEKCCSRLNSRIRYFDQPCPCAVGGTTTAAQQTGFCQYQGPNVAATDDTAGALQAASSTTFNCCTQTRFPELNTVTNAAGTTFTRFQRSFCVDSLASDGFRCCTDGNVYDAGSQQCCTVTGVQTLNLPCPCGAASDCPTGSGCCFQIFPPGLPRGQGASQCSMFANYPRSDNGGGDGGDVILSVPGNPLFQRCPGTCYDNRYQMCCNGVVCESSFTRCCNDSCCNKFSETCQLSLRSPVSSLSNSRDLGVYFQMCSRIEDLSGLKAFFVFVLPAWLLLATAISLALVTVLARRATEHIFELTERAIVVLAVITVLLGCPFFFSPFYKNGIVIVLIGLVSILVAVARQRKASLLLVILLVAAIFYVINPFDGNIYFSITSAVPVYGARPEPSLLEAAQNLWRTSENCVAFYDFFIYDPMHRDQRLDNPEDFTFGYCGRSYITALIIFAIALYVVLLLLLLLAVFSLVKKLGIKAVEPIELEVAMEPELVY